MTYAEAFTTREPDAPTGRRLAVDIVDPSDPSAKPPAVHRVALELHPGARFDTDALPQCRATDLDVLILGAGACPPDAVVGVDEFVFDTGLVGPLRFVTVDATVFNAPGELLFIASLRDLAVVRLPVRGRVDGNRLTIDIPPLPGVPDGTALTRERGTFEAVTGTTATGERRAFLTTPPVCPASGSWTNRVTYTFADGATEVVESSTPCNGAPAPPVVAESGGPGASVDATSGGPARANGLPVTGGSTRPAVVAVAMLGAATIVHVTTHRSPLRVRPTR